MFPVESTIPEIARALAQNREVVLTAPPGSGKTTCVPLALLNEPFLANKKIIMLEPRRLAARNCATFMAHKLNEKVGETVGYAVRLERKVSARTRLEIVTEGLLTQRLIADPELRDVGLVIFDEFHERSLACDLSFALTLDVRRALREDLRVLVMSATLDVDELAHHLDQPACVATDGSLYPVATHYLGDVPLAVGVAKALRETDGDILCFLPGEGEIRRACENLANFATDNLAIFPLYGALSKDEQEDVFAKSEKRKIILATSIAETSVTIPNITCVIDSGLMRLSRFSPSTGMSALVTVPLSMDRAEQRRGRAGRVRAGVCYRLWDEAQNAMRPKKMTPEIFDADLCSLVLTCASWGAFSREALPWLTPPPDSAWEQATRVLKFLGALDAGGRLTAKGEEMARLPIHPRLANMLLLSGPHAALLAAQIEEGAKSRETDIRFREISPRVKELAKRFRVTPAQVIAKSDGASLALAYPDRLAKNRGTGSFRMVSGRGVTLAQDDPLAKEKFIVCCQLDQRVGDAKLFLGCPIDESEILAIFGDQIVEVPVCEWNRENERVKFALERRLGEMTMGEKPIANRENFANEIAAAMLAGIREKGLANVPCWTKDSRQMRARMAFLFREIGTPWREPNDDEIFAMLANFLNGITSWRQLEKVDMSAVLEAVLSDWGLSRRELDTLAPTRMEVPSGSHMTIQYDGDEPTVAVRLQECFGLMTTPKVAGGRVSIVMTLLSPAQRPVQVTKDLANFWRESYPLVRKDLRGRYPKHYWPEDPFSAVATRHVRPREK